MNQQMLEAMNDGELVQVIAWALGEQKSRDLKRRKETIGKIKDLAKSAGVSLKINDANGLRKKMPKPS